MKIIGLGLSKTGTSTLRAALEILGYRVAPNSGLTRDVIRGRLDEAFRRLEQYDACEDMPWPLMFEPIFERYGTDAKYILTVRDSTDRWLRSFKNYSLLKDPFKKLRQPIMSYGRRYPFGFEDEFAGVYESHNQHVRDFFRERNADSSLLVACWETGTGWEELCRHLGRDVPEVSFPQKNVTAKRKWHYSRHWANAALAHLMALSQGRKVTDRIFVRDGR